MRERKKEKKMKERKKNPTIIDWFFDLNWNLIW